MLPPSFFSLFLLSLLVPFLPFRSLFNHFTPSLPIPGIKPQLSSPKPSHYTNWVTATLIFMWYLQPWFNTPSAKKLVPKWWLASPFPHRKCIITCWFSATLVSSDSCTPTNRIYISPINSLANVFNEPDILTPDIQSSKTNVHFLLLHSFQRACQKYKALSNILTC